MTERFRIEQRPNFEGTRTWYVVDSSRGDRPDAEFDTKEAAEAHLERLRAAASDVDPDGTEGPMPPAP